MDGIRRLIEAVEEWGQCVCGEYSVLQPTTKHAPDCPLEAARRELSALTNTNRERYEVRNVRGGLVVWDTADDQMLSTHDVIGLLNWPFD